MGHEAVCVLDQLIVVCLKANSRTAPRTHEIEKNDLQWAACQLIPAGISLTLSIRELVRQGYIYGALVLLRPLAERAVTIRYLQKFPDNIDLWTRGWSHKERLNLAKMFNEIAGSEFPNCGPEITRSLNSLIHGDPASAMWNLVKTGDGSRDMAFQKFWVGPIYAIEFVLTQLPGWLSYSK